MEILRRDPQQRSMKDIEQLINHFSRIEFFSSYTAEGCRVHDIIYIFNVVQFLIIWSFYYV